MPKTDIEVELTDEDGNALAILGKVSKALRRNGRADLVDDYMAEATAGGFNHLLRTTMEYVEVI